jgi:hypothetical protein
MHCMDSPPMLNVRRRFSMDPRFRGDDKVLG